MNVMQTKNMTVTQVTMWTHVFREVGSPLAGSSDFTIVLNAAQDLEGDRRGGANDSIPKARLQLRIVGLW